MTLFGFFRSEMEVGFGGMGILNLITEISKYKYSRYLKKLALLRSAIEKLAFSFLMITYNISFINFKFLGIKLMFIPKKYIICFHIFYLNRRTYSQRRQNQAARKIQQFMRQSKIK